MKGKGLVLIGYRGAGKSALGQRLADRLKVPFVDTDDLVERAFGRPLIAVFDELGEGAFREREAEVVAALSPLDEQIVATGGGAVIGEANRRHLGALGLVVWLRADAELLSRRIAGSGRPSLTGQPSHLEVGEVLRAREPLYDELADEVVDVDERSVEEICDVLQQLWRGLSHHDLR